MKNYYEILGVGSGASSQEIKKVYRSLAKKYHPDINPGDKAAEEKIKEINEAYQTLGDEKLKKAYDEKLDAVKNRKTSSTGFDNTTKKSSTEDLKKNSNPNFDANKAFNEFFGAKSRNDSSKEDKKNNPLNTDQMFENFMGFKRKKDK